MPSTPECILFRDIVLGPDPNWLTLLSLIVVFGGDKASLGYIV